jgi:hypothetical protein
MARGVKFGRELKLSQYQREETIRRRAAGETLTAIAASCVCIDDIAPGLRDA